MKERLSPKSILICHLDLDWSNTGNVCRGEVFNNSQSIRKHMVVKHGWKDIPELAQRECKTKQDEIEKIKLYLDSPGEWFLDNQFLWSDIRSIHFRQKTSKGLRNLRSLMNHG
jgi:hypothetical protein